MTIRPARAGVEAALVLPAAFAGLLLIGVVAVAAAGGVPPAGVLALATALIGGLCLVAEARAAPAIAVIGWFSDAAFARPPYGDLHFTGTGRAAVVLSVTAAAASAAGAGLRRPQRSWVRGTLGAVTPAPGRSSGSVVALPEPEPWQPAPSNGLTARRVLLGLAVAAATLPLLTVALTALRGSLALIDEVLIYLLVVIAVSLVGGFWPSVLTALAADLILNWYFTVPLHHWTIAAPADLIALVLFIASAVTVSSVVHAAARRAHIASERSAEAGALLDLARTVLGGDDSPEVVLEHLTRTLGVPAEMYERHGTGWLKITGTAGAEPMRAAAGGPEFRLVTYGDPAGNQARLLPAYAAQAAAACERQRLRIQAAQAEVLAEGNRIRTALLAAVSHDLRTPLASIKAAVDTLRQTDIHLSADDRAALLATIQQGADRLDALVANLLDMSRIHTGSVQPFLRPAAVDEIVLQALRAVDDDARVQLDIPDTLPLVTVDPGLFERAAANVITNALRYSPPHRPPAITATTAADITDMVTVLVIDHGPGVPPDAYGQIFAPFQQLGDRSTTDGVGLGLAVARGFLRAMGASIGAQDTPGGGLTMRIDLPIARSTAITIRAAAART